MIEHQAKTVTPAQLSKQLGVSQHRILAWINSGELKAVNLAGSLGARPRWKIMLTEVDAFLARRSSQPEVKVQRRRKLPEPIVDYYP